MCAVAAWHLMRKMQREQVQEAQLRTASTRNQGTSNAQGMEEREGKSWFSLIKDSALLFASGLIGCHSW